MSGPRRKAGKSAGNIPELLALGEQIAERRRSLGRLQNEVAESAGVSRSTLHTIEHGGSGVRWEKIAAVSHELGLSLKLVENDRYI
ncbi:helix-turn-helix domain-containing protein [Corynebacterium uropygiale]|uniref:Helix-turn-helix domain-containing protein n=1 Tax=Corynebacterium uropygiale TaxID=1775911 RepID=A0A9X1QQR2_9CORY|nr:helix-turn-helix transcriptional regulator [Corynebacterium uropygiale]MCF4005834.1 helix-turn-helix domain-containing protein [Corynebacterium uropygiale]